jgi:hypothetical protein
MRQELMCQTAGLMKDTETDVLTVQVVLPSPDPVHLEIRWRMTTRRSRTYMDMKGWINQFYHQSAARFLVNRGVLER